MPQPLFLAAVEIVTVEGPPDAPDPRVVPIHIVTVSVQSSPTLVDGVPQ